MIPDNPIPISVSIIITEKNNQPCIELRRVTTNAELIKTIISAAFHNRQIIIQPTFKDSMKSLSSLVQKGILYRKDQEYHFTI